MERVPKIVFRTLLALSIAAGTAFSAIVIFSPHVLALLREGYPAQIWPAGGSFAVVEGVEHLDAAAYHTTLPQGLKASFETSGGRAFLAERGGTLVASGFATGVSPATRFNSFSLVKSLVGFLVLKAIDDGVIPSLDARLGAIDPSLAAYPVGKLALREILDMRSGISFEVNGSALASSGDANGEKALEAVPYNPFGPLARLHALGIDAVLPFLRISAQRQGSFEYQNVNTALAGKVLEAAYGEKLENLLSRQIWKPSGASQAQWRQYSSLSSVSPYCCLYATASDWLHVARFLLDNGTPDNPLLTSAMHSYWIGDDIGPQERHKGIYRSFTRYDVLDRPGKKAQGPFAYFLGQNGQVIYIHPGLDLVVIRFGQGMQLLHSTLYELE
ncbi:MAG: serine hydrolase [Nitratireductor sp.]|nr:serine hydrolase [Nitratireductor sp.]